MRRASLPALAALCGIHGEFELCFSVPPEAALAMRSLARECGLEPLQLGHVTERNPEQRGLRIGAGTLDTPRIRDAWVKAQSIEDYVATIVSSVRLATTSANALPSTTSTMRPKTA